MGRRGRSLALGMGWAVMLTSAALAVPSYSRQTGDSCAACHVSAFGPQLTPHGQAFKLKAYAESTGTWTPPVSAMAVVSYLHTDKDNPAYAKYNPTKQHYIAMDGREVYRFAVRVLHDTLVRCCEESKVRMEDISLIVPHQANIRIIEAAASRLGVSMDKMYVNVDRYGNTSGSSIPLCVDELNRAGRLHRGQRIALTGFGAGLTCGSIVMDW